MVYNKIKKYLLLLIFPLFTTMLHGQEILCSFEIDTRQVEGTEKQVFETMKRAVNEFLNNRKWTNYEFEVDEKIECSMLLIVEDRNFGTNEYSGRLNIALRRPVFNASYTTILFNYVDKDVKFKYIENQPLDFDQNNYTSNLTSLMAFYIYLFIGLDFDSFLLEGGTPYYSAAQNVVNAAQNSEYKGWKSFDSQRNRFWMVENLLNSAYSPLRSFLYDYHRMGLDVMHEDAEQGRVTIQQSLSYLKAIHSNRPGLPLLQILVDAKREEIINVFSEGSANEKSQAAEIMVELDPSHTTDYRRITE